MGGIGQSKSFMNCTNMEAPAVDEKNDLKTLHQSISQQQKSRASSVVGKREADDRTVALRRLGGKNQEILALKDAMDTLMAEAAGPLGAGEG